VRERRQRVAVALVAPPAASAIPQAVGRDAHEPRLGRFGASRARPGCECSLDRVLDRILRVGQSTREAERL
jgi:hypothetical protein